MMTEGYCSRDQYGHPTSSMHPPAIKASFASRSTSGNTSHLLPSPLPPPQPPPPLQILLLTPRRLPPHPHRPPPPHILLLSRRRPPRHRLLKPFRIKHPQIRARPADPRQRRMEE